MAYDEYARLQNRHIPGQNAGANTGYTYFDDDTVHTVTDARGATTTFGYNGRHLVTSLSYGVPTGVAATPDVGFQYDAAGNRTSMTDGQGWSSYAYNGLSQMTSEASHSMPRIRSIGPGEHRSI